MADWEQYSESPQETVDWSKFSEPTKPLFSSVEEGRTALKKDLEELKKLKFEASPFGFAASQIVGGINSAIDAASMGGLEAVAGAFGTTMIPRATSDATRGIGSGVGNLIPLTAGAKIGNVAGKAIAGSTAGKSIARAVLPEKANKFAKELQKEFVGIKKAASSKWSDDIAKLSEQNPDKTVSLRNVVDNINASVAEMSPEARNVFNKTPLLSNMLKNPELADKVSLKDAQDVLNYINTKVPKDIKANSLDIVEALSDIRASQLEAFPEMADVRAAYARVAEPWKNIKNSFRFNKTLHSVYTDFGGPEGKAAVKSLFPKETIDAMGGYKNAVKVTTAIKNAIGFSLIGGAVGVGGKAGYELVK